MERELEQKSFSACRSRSPIIPAHHAYACSLLHNDNVSRPQKITENLIERKKMVLVAPVSEGRSFARNALKCGKVTGEQNR